MLFAKTELLKNPSPLNIGIVGVSALSFYLAAELQKAGHRLTLICLPAEADEFNATDFIIKDGHRLQNLRQTFHCAFELETPPELLLIASDLIRLRSDLLLVSPSRLNEAPVVCLTPEYPAGLTGDMLGRPVINGYFGGSLVREKNHITCFSHHNRLTFSLDETAPATSFMRDVFAGTDIEIRADENDTLNFWNWFAPRVVISLLNRSTGKPLPAFGKTAQGRKIIDNCIAEVSALASNDGARLDDTEILTRIYNLHDDCAQLPAVGVAQSLLLLERLTALLFRGISPEDQRFPVLRGLLRQIRNKP